MATLMNVDDRPRVPDDIARIVISPRSYADDATIYPAFRWLRENMPLGIAEIEGYDPIWLVSKHADLKFIEREHKTFRNCGPNAILNDKASDEFTRSLTGGSLKVISSLTYMDAPEHGAYRSITSNWFLPGRISKLEHQIRELAKKSVERLLDFDGECDFAKDFALHYPLRVIMTLFGVPQADEPRMLKLTQEFFGVHDPDEQREGLADDPVAAAKMWAASLQDFYSYFDDLSAERRRNPTDDLLSLIANSQVNGQPIAREEANGYYVAIATAGHDTTSSTTVGGMHGMIASGQFDLVRDDHDTIKPMIEEALRWASPVKHFMRNATTSTEVRGQRIDEGDRFMLCYPSANRDEDVFSDPDTFDVRRSPNPHLAFGFGPHMCLGQHLAKLEMRVLYEELLPHLASVELAGDPTLVKTNFVGGYKSLPIRFKKR